MPSIIGNSTISGITLSFTGPTGFTGPIGPRGPVGPPGLTLGPTGATALYIKDVISDVANNTITFKLSDNRNIGPIFGFTGPTVNFSSSKAINGFSAENYKSFLMGVCGGLTFQFRGICGDGQLVFPALSSDGTEIILTIGTITGGVSYGNTAANQLMYSTPSGRLSATKIKIIETSIVEDETSPNFSTQLPSTILNLGLTFTAAPTPNVVVYSDFTESYISIPGIARNSSPALPIQGISGIDSGGYILNLDTSSVFKLATPLGITAFHRNSGYSRKYVSEGIGDDSVTLDSWLLFIDGADVWNLPPNLLFNTNNSTGIGSFGFCKGMNILRIQSDYERGVYYATFVDRCFGNDSNMQYGGIGSCCYSSGCEDYVTEDYCTEVLQGTFTALKNCKQSCNIGSCCINGICRDNVTRDVCVHFTGSVNAWSSTPCPNGDGTSCVVGTKTYSLQKTNTTEPVALLSNTTRAAPQKVGEFRVICDDTSFKITAPSFITDAASVSYGLFSFKKIPSQFGSDIDGTGTAGLTFSAPVIGTTFAIYFDNNAKTITNKTYPVLEIPLVIRDSSNTIKSGITFSVRPVFASSGCGSDPNVVRVKTAFKLNRYCTDCYTVNSTLGGKNWYPVQEQYGTFDYCYNLATQTRSLVCASSTETTELNACGKTDGDAEGIPTILNVGCVHRQYKYLDVITGRTGGRCFNPDEDGCGCGNNYDCCCGACFKPEMDPTSPNYGLCVYSGCPSISWIENEGSSNEEAWDCAKYAAFRGINVGDWWPDAQVCSGGQDTGIHPLLNTGVDQRNRSIIRPGFSGRRFERGSAGEVLNPAFGLPENQVYWYDISFWPSIDGLKGELSLLGITGITAEIGWIQDTIHGLKNPQNGIDMFFTKENNSKNVSLSGSGITCCDYNSYILPSGRYEVNWSAAEGSVVKYYVVKGFNKLWYDIPCQLPGGDCSGAGSGGPVSQGQCCNGDTRLLWKWATTTDSLLLRCVFTGSVGTGFQLTQTPCVVASLVDNFAFAASIPPVCGTNGCGGNYGGEASFPDVTEDVLELLPGNATVIDGKKYAIIGVTSSGLIAPLEIDPRVPVNGYYKKYVLNTTKADLAFMTDANRALFRALVYENIQKSRYCTCNPTTTSEKLCLSEPCTIPASTCVYSAPNSFYRGWTDACATTVGATMNQLVLVQDPDNTQNTTGYNTFEPRLYEVDLVANTSTLLNNRWLYYSTGRLLENSDKNTINSMNAPAGLTANIKAIKSGTRFTVPVDGSDILTTQPIGDICVYWTDTPDGVKEDFFARTKNIKNFIRKDPTKYTNSLGKSLILDSSLRPLLAAPEIDITNDFLTFNVSVKLRDASIDALTQDGWIIRAWSYKLWTKKQPETGTPIVAPYNETRSDDGGTSLDDNITIRRNSSSLVFFGPFTYNKFPTDDFSDTNFSNFQITTMVLVSKKINFSIPPGNQDPTTRTTEDYRTIQYTETYGALRPGANPRLTTDTRSSGKIITANGQSQCVQINCVEFGDCLGMEDC